MGARTHHRHNLTEAVAPVQKIVPKKAVRTTFRETVDNFLEGLIPKFYDEVPYATHQKDSASVNLNYYTRHTIETILRLRLKRSVDALTILYFTKRDPQLAKLWAAYTEDEMLHDAWFVADLNKVGVLRDQIYATEPLLATKLLQGYFYYGFEHEGTPLAALCSSYFIEYTTVRTQPEWLDNLQASLGEDKVRGARAHVHHDVLDEHVDLVWKVLTTFVVSADDERRVVAHMQDIYRLFVAYFTELYESTVADKNDNSSWLSIRAV
jgi:hypothetical protein